MGTHAIEVLKVDVTLRESPLNLLLYFGVRPDAVWVSNTCQRDFESSQCRQ
jgi:hypothetical protein